MKKNRPLIYEHIILDKKKMPAAAAKKRKSRSSKAKSKKLPEVTPNKWRMLVGVSAISGAIMGLACPGIDQWYLAWLGMVPFFLALSASSSIGFAALNGLAFGFVYNAIYFSWLLGLHPLGWLGFNEWQSMALAGLSLAVVAGQQAIITAVFAALVKLMPLHGGFMPRQIDNKWHLPSLIVVPLLWVLIENKIGNSPALLGVPLSMLEYTQYLEPAVMKMASFIGGIGIGFLIVMCNVAIAGLISSSSKKFDWKSFASTTYSDSMRQALIVAVTILALIGLGSASTPNIAGGQTSFPKVPVSIVQSNLNIEIQKDKRHYGLSEVLGHNLNLLSQCPSGLVILCENALPTFLKNQPLTLAALELAARAGNYNLVVGAIDKDNSGRIFNAAYGITSGGNLVSNIYHKRNLVPIGEFTPQFMYYLPDFVQKLTNTQTGKGFSPGTTPAILHFGKEQNIAPLICFEILSPELATASVRNGGQLLVNLADLGWFHKSIIGRQMIACAITRAAETGRYVILAANTGPSAIVSPEGHVLKLSKSDTAMSLSGQAELRSGYTPFTLWFY